MKKIIALLLLLTLLTGCTTAAPPATQPVETTEATEATVLTEATEATETTEATEPAAEVDLAPGDPDTLTVHFIDVAHADGMLIECNGHFALVDAGMADTSDRVVNYLASRGVEKLDLVVGTHPHADHIGGMPDVLANYPVDNVWFSAIPYTNYTVTNFLNSVRWRGRQVVRPANGTVFDLGGATITVLGPIRDNHEDVNDISLVLMVQYGDVRFLLTGDMESIAEKELVESGADLKADVLKVGHHGSYSSTSYIFLREVMPTYAVISLAAGNEYGHPHDEPMSRLRDAEVIIYQTAKMYNISATTDGTDITFKWDNKYAEPWKPSK